MIVWFAPSASTVTESPSPTLPYPPQRWGSSKSPDEKLVSRNVVAAGVRHLDAVRVERRDELDVDVTGKLLGLLARDLQDEYSGFLSPEA